MHDLQIALHLAEGLALSARVSEVSRRLGAHAALPAERVDRASRRELALQLRHDPLERGETLVALPVALARPIAEALRRLLVYGGQLGRRKARTHELARCGDASAP